MLKPPEPPSISAPLGGKGVQGASFRQPRKAKPRTNHHPESTSGSGTPVENGPSGPGALKRDTEQSELLQDLQRRHDALSGELDSLRSELQNKVSLIDERDRTITSFTTEVAQWKQSDATKREQIATAHRDYARLQGDFSAISSKTADLQRRYDAQSKDIFSIRNDHQAKVLLLEEKEHTITFLSEEVAQAKHENSEKTEQIATERRDAERLRGELSSASSRFAELQERYEAQSRELTFDRNQLHQTEASLEKNKEFNRVLAESTTRNNELQKSNEALSKKVGDICEELRVKTSQYEGTITSLTAKVDKWKSADAAKAEQIAATLVQVEGFRRDLSASNSRVTELQGRYEVQSREFIEVRNELRARLSSEDSKDRTIVSLTAEVERWKGADADKEEQLAATLEQVEELKYDISTSASQLAELRSLYETQSHDLTSVRNELKASTSSSESKDHIITSLTTELEEWRGAGANNEKQVAVILRQVAKLEHDLSTSTSRLADLQSLYEAQSHDLAAVREELQSTTLSSENKGRTITSLTTELEEWKDASANYEEQVEKLEHDLSTYTSRLADLQILYDEQSHDLATVRDDLQSITLSSESNDRTIISLTAELEEWKDASANHEERVEKLKHDLSTYTSRLSDLQSLYDEQSHDLATVRDDLQSITLSSESNDRTITSLTAELEEWKGASANHREQVEKPEHELTTYTSRLTDLQSLYDEQLRQLAIVHDELQSSTSSGEAKDLTITSLTAKVEEWKRASASYEEQIAITHKQVEKLEHDLSTSTSHLGDLQSLCDEQSRDLTALRSELESITLSGERKDHTIASLTTEVEKWKDLSVRNEEQVEKLEHVLSASASRLGDLQNLFDDQSRQFAVVRDELESSTLSGETKDRIIASLTAEVEKWKDTNASNEEQVAIILEQVQGLEQDLSASTSRLGDLQGLCDEQSRDLTAVRSELQSSTLSGETKDLTIASLTAEVEKWKGASASSEEQVTISRKQVDKLEHELSTSTSRLGDLQRRKDHAIASLTAEVEQWKGASADNEERVAIALEQVESLERDLSTSTSRLGNLQNLFDDQSRQFAGARDELESSTLSGENKDCTIASLTTEVEKWKNTSASNEEQVAITLERVQILERDLSTSTSRLGDLQSLCDEQLRDLTTVRGELQSSTLSGENKDLTIASLTAEVERWKDANASNEEQVAATLERVQELEQDLSTSTSRLGNLQNLFDDQSRQFAGVRDELQSSTLSGENKDRTIASLTTEVEKWKGVSATNEEQVEKLEHDLSASASRLGDLQSLSDKQSRQFDAVREELESSTLSGETKDRIIASLTAEVEKWKDTSARNENQVAITLERVQKLEYDLSTSASHLGDLQGLCDEQSRDLTAARSELESSTLSGERKDHTITSLAAEVEKWKGASADNETQVTTILERVEKLEYDLSTSTSQFTELQSRYEAQLRETVDVRSELHVRISSEEGKDELVTSLASQVEGWKLSDARLVEELATAHKDLKQLRNDLVNSSSQIERLEHSDIAKAEGLAAAQKELEQLHRDLSASSSQFEGLKVSDAAKAEELAAARKDLEQFCMDLATSSSQIEGLKRSDIAKAEELTAAQKDLEQLRRDLSASSSQIEGLKRSDLAKAEELAASQKDLEQLRRDLSTSSSQFIELRQRYAAQSSQLEQSKHSDAAKVEELTAMEERLRQLQQELTSSSSRIDELQKRHEAQLTELNTLREKVKSMLLLDADKDDMVTSLNAQIEHLQRGDVAKTEKLARAHKDLEQLRRELSALSSLIDEPRKAREIQQRYEEQLRELRAALAKREAQLDGVQRFVTTADIYADTMIIQMLQKLNAEVQQNTTLIAEHILEDFQPRAKTLSEEQISATQRVSGYIGQTLAGCLGGEECDDVALYLPIAFQAYLAHHLCGIISAWTIEKEHSDLINAIYERLQKTEAQTISGRWRSLTRTYISPTCISQPDTFISSTVAGLSDIVVAAGCAADASAAQSKISFKFKDKVTSIILIAGQFSKMIGDVVSGDFETFAVRPDEVFEEATMEEDADDYDEGESNQTAVGQKVLCSTHLGLSKRVPLGTGKKDTLTVMKAKVLLESF